MGFSVFGGVSPSQRGDANDTPKRLGNDYTPVHEFVYKLDRIPERLYTAAARAIESAARLYSIRPCQSSLFA